MTQSRLAPGALIRRTRSRHRLLEFLGAGRVLEFQFLVGEDVMERAMAHQRGFVKAREDQLQLAGIIRHVADAEYAGYGGFKLLGVDGDAVLVEVEAEIGDRPQLPGET